MKTRCLSIKQVLQLKREIQLQLDQLQQDLQSEQADQRAELTLVDSSEFRDRGEASSSSVTNLTNLTLIAHINSEIRECEHALKRIDEGDYGACENCDQEIELNRLMANPTAALCISCQSKEEVARGAGRAVSF